MQSLTVNDCDKFSPLFDDRFNTNRSKAVRFPGRLFRLDFRVLKLIGFIISFFMILNQRETTKYWFFIIVSVCTFFYKERYCMIFFSLL